MIVQMGCPIPKHVEHRFRPCDEEDRWRRAIAAKLLAVSVFSF